MLPATSHRLVTARERLGLSQAELAAAAGVSRSQVSAVEQGRHTPAVDAALRLAAAVGQSVEELFAPVAERRPAATGVIDPLADGTPVRTARVGDRLVAAPAGPDAGPLAWAAADATVRGGGVEALPGGRSDGCVVAGCDPALAAVDRLSAARGPGLVVAGAAATGDALRALAAGRCHGVLVHDRAGRLPAPPIAVRRWRFARWEVGIAHDRRGATPSIEALLSGPGPLVRRARSAASDEALVRAARRLGIRPPRRDVVAAGHLDAAQRTAWTGAPAVTYRPAATALGLGFAALEEHVVELWVAEPWHDHPGVATALEIVGSRAYRERLACQDGYDLAGAGTAVEAAA